MPGPHRIPDPLRGEVFRGSEALREGLITRKQLAANWRRLFRDVYADITIEPSHAIRCHAVMRYVLPEATITGASAAYLYGVKIIPADGPVEVVLPVPHGPVRGVLLHHGPVRPADIDMRDGLRVSTPLRACWDLLRHRPFTAAMAFVDQLIRANLVTSGGLTDYAEAHRREPGSRLMLRAADIADAGAESPQESRTRVGLIACGVPAPVTQHVITDRGRFVGRADMAWPDYFVALEYDGYKPQRPRGSGS